ncbi:hypothetical protein CY34DRAFT_133330 [Suillus luteus UH-Slu-Lm8-n1]|uniref:Uncharacterized protein n=1 Tax=Suillus luteus UH-Slu-Lm8-n1 TaxID=930992 RepID=A0A0D0A391_9AGAM|nr:hypothetical protein CY34DRAFT_133330 [Suillus luteus UH-Slu-Lm8-n1]
MADEKCWLLVVWSSCYVPITKLTHIYIRGYHLLSLSWHMCHPLMQLYQWTDAQTVWM